MAKKKLDEVQFLATWLFTAAQQAGQVELVRKLINSAMKESVEMYGSPKEEDLEDPTEEIPAIISKFAAMWTILIASHEKSKGPVHWAQPGFAGAAHSTGNLASRER